MSEVSFIVFGVLAHSMPLDVPLRFRGVVQSNADDLELTGNNQLQVCNSAVVSTLDCQLKGQGLKSLHGQKLFLWFLLHLYH